MCNIIDVVFPPSEYPTTSPTNYTSPNPTTSAPEYDDVIYTSFCGPTYLDASASCSIQTYCPRYGFNMNNKLFESSGMKLTSSMTNFFSGVHTDCPENQYCWSSTTCNVHDFWPPPSPSPTNSPIIENPPSDIPSGAPSVEPIGLPTHSPLDGNDPANFMYCGIDWMDASTKCRIKCPNQICPNGMMCFTGTGCPAIPYESSAPTDPDRTLAPSLMVETTPSPSVVAATLTPRLNSTNAPTVSSGSPSILMTTNLTYAPEDNLITSNSLNPSILQTRQPTTTSSLTFPPTKAKQYPQILSLPDVSKPMSRSPENNIQTVQDILQNIRPTLESEVFVVETRAGNFIPSNIYTFDGLLPGVLYYAQRGVNGDYFYLGEEGTILHGLVNLALFLAKVVTDSIAYEGCDPNKLACGMWALDTTFQGNTRFQCAESSENAGLECLDGSIGCACIIGMLDYRIGSKSINEPTPYSDVKFCSIDPYESICSKYLDAGDELRWIAPMSYWVSFVQRYQSTQSGYVETYMLALDTFVQNGMQHTSFVEFVAGISIYEGAARAPKEKYVDSYFKIMDLLLSGYSILVPEEATLSPSRDPTNNPLPLQTGIPTTKPAEALKTPLPSVTVDNQSSVNDNPVEAHKTPMPSVSIVDNQSLANNCPLLCVVPIKTIECPVPGHRLKQCFSSIIGIDELCTATYGECNTSKVSVNDCGRSYNIFRRIDCSILVDYPHSEQEVALESNSSAPDTIGISSSRPVSSTMPSWSSEYQKNDYSGFDSPPSASSIPTTKPSSDLGGMVWWQTISSSGERTSRTKYMLLILVGHVSITLQLLN